MKKVTAYLYPQCGSCRKAKAWLKEHGYEIDEIHIVNNPPDKETLRSLWQKSGEELKKFFNTSGARYRELGLKDKLPNLTEEQMLDYLVSDGKLIKRPIVTDGEKVTVGFKEAQFDEEWGN